MGRATHRPGLRQWMGGALLLVLVPGVIASIVLQYRSIERHQANELSADLELARAVGTTFDTYVQDLLHQELAIGLAVPLALGDRGVERSGFAAVPWERGAMTVGVIPIAGLGWAAVAGRPAGAVMGPIVRDALWNLGVLLVFWAFALFGALVVARRVTRPVRALRAHAAALGRGELDLPAPVDGPSEVRDLAEAINAMAAALAAREREREDYTHAISHDLRTPLTAILINAQLLRAAQERDGVDAVQRRRAESIELCAQDMHGLIRDLLDSVRLDEGQLRLDLGGVDVGHLACNVVARLSDADAARVEVTVDPGLPPVSADAQRLERVLANLIGNALRYSPTSTPVRVAVEASDGQLRVGVRDEGPGIEPDELPRLFQRHSRTSSGLARSDSLGLGLYIVRGIVAAHDGRVWVDSVVGRGSTFGFTIPLTSPLAGDTALAVGDPSTAA